MIRHCTVLVPRFISTETEKQNVIRRLASSPCKSMLVPIRVWLRGIWASFVCNRVAAAGSGSSPCLLRSCTLLCHKCPLRPVSLRRAFHSDSWAANHPSAASLPTAPCSHPADSRRGVRAFRPRFLQNIILPCFFACTAQASVCERPFLLHTAFRWPFATKESPYCNSMKKKEVTVLSYQDGRILHATCQLRGWSATP